jgi:DNA-directed RNA polymerase sigma subunit (sigma70/sigma32)
MRVWTRDLAPGQSFRGNLWLEPHPAIRERLASLQPRAKKLLELRYGWGGNAPRTIAEAAAEVKLPPVRAAAMERRALGGLGRGPKARA